MRTARSLSWGVSVRGVCVWGPLYVGGPCPRGYLSGRRPPRDRDSLPLLINRMTDTRLRLWAVIILPTMNFGTNKANRLSSNLPIITARQRSGEVMFSVVSLYPRGSHVTISYDAISHLTIQGPPPHPLGHVKMCSTKSSLYTLSHDHVQAC